MYGIPDHCPITKDFSAYLINPYWEPKLFMERILVDIARAYRISWTALRYFNAAGSDSEGDCDESHNPETHLIPRAFMAITGELGDFRVMGNDYPTQDGTCIRDYVHPSDLAASHVLAMERLYAEQDGHGISLNLGTGTGFSIKEILHAVEQVTGRHLPYTAGDRREGDPPVLVADGACAKKFLNWKLCRSYLAAIIEDAWNWHVSGRDMVLQAD